jgi:PAS domain S-box-containing protein
MNDRVHEHSDIEDVIVGGGETGALMRTIDWSQTPLGPVHDWPQSFRTALSIAMSSRFPITLYWGSEFLMLYNDDLLPMVGANKHPWALGRPAFEVLPEIRSIIEPLLRKVVDTGEAIWSEDLMLPMQRGDAPEEGYFTFTYSPVRDESGGVGGVFCAVLETTDKIIEGRRLRLLNALTDATQARTPAEACAFAAAKIAEATSDVPFALLYLADEAAGVVRLAGIANIDADDALAPSTIPFGDASVWPFDLGEAENKERLVPLEEAPGNARGAVILPIERPGGGRALGFIVAGLSNLLRSSESYGRFHHLLAASVAQIVSNAAAHEAERKRAEALAEIDHAKTAFFSNVSHEFRTPLTLLLGPAEDALHDPTTSAATRDRLEIIHRNALRLQKLVTALLDFSRIEAGRMQASYALTNVATLTADVASAFRSAIENAGLRFRVDTPAIELPVYLDRGMWETILLNLLSNAFKFTLRGEITVRLRQIENGVELVVSDTGSGIPERELPHIFQRFHRVKGTEGRTHEGTGIGLALIQELVKLHGGTISVRSKEREGTTFTVFIPAGSAHLPADRIGTSAAAVSSAAVSDVYVDETVQWLRKERVEEAPAARENVDGGRSRPRIVLADDNSDMREYVRGLLASRYDVVACPDGRAALEEIRRNPPDLVLSDVMMPELDGFGLLAALRADAALSTLPVILLSARAGEESTIEGMEAGADDYLIKPFSARELMARVGAQIGISMMRREAQRAVADSERRLRAIVEQTTAGIAQADREGRFVFVNDRFCEIAGRSREDLLSLGMHEILYAEDLPQNLAMPFVVEQRYVRNDGSLVWVSSNVSRMVGEDDEPAGMLTVSIDITDRKRVEQALASTAAELDAALAISSVGTWRWDFERNLAPLTPSYRRMLGLDASMQEIGPEQFLRIVHPDDRARIGESLEQIRSEGSDLDLECRILFPAGRADGEVRWMLFRGGPILDERGAVTGILGASLDITQRKEIERRLQASEARFREFIDTAPAMLWLTEPDGSCSLLSKGWYEFTGQSPAEALGRGWMNAMHPDDREESTRVFLAANAAHEAFAHDYRIRRADGAYRWALGVARPRFAEDGSFLGFIGSVIDITDRKLAEDQLLENERRFRFMLDAMPQKVFTARPNGDVDYFNPQWTDFTGLTLDEIASSGWTRFIHPDDAEANVRGWVRALETGEAFFLEHRFRRADGEDRWHLSRALPVRDRDGEILMWIGASTDIHAFKEAEQVLRDADRMKDEFLATLSHELRTPLTSIIGWSHLLLRANLPKAERIVGLESIRNSAKTQSQLIEDVLDISRIVTGKMRLEREPADLAAIIDEAVAAVRPAAEAKRMPLTVSLDRSLGRHFLDPMRIQQIVWNLLTNAIKFSPNGAPIDVSLRSESSSAVVVITDEGPGISADFLPMIFERFRQADGSARRGHTGLGLGLALVKELTELHGGTIQVESEVGRGTRFTVSLPLPAVRQLDQGEKEARQTSRERPLTGIRVLYIDDVEDARLMVSTMLREYGAEVESASSASDALLTLQRIRPHVVVTDIAMPDRDGFDLLQAIQSDATWGELPVIALTAQSGIDDERRAKAAGFRSYLRKPVDVDHFVSVLAHVVNPR